MKEPCKPFESSYYAPTECRTHSGYFWRQERIKSYSVLKKFKVQVAMLGVGNGWDALPSSHQP